jgi:hypothetical protein
VRALRRWKGLAQTAERVQISAGKNEMNDAEQAQLACF